MTIFNIDAWIVPQVNAQSIAGKESVKILEKKWSTTKELRADELVELGHVNGVGVYVPPQRLEREGDTFSIDVDVVFDNWADYDEYCRMLVEDLGFVDLATLD